MLLEFLRNIKFKRENERPLVLLMCFCLHFVAIYGEILQFI